MLAYRLNSIMHGFVPLVFLEPRSHLAFTRSRETQLHNPEIYFDGARANGEKYWTAFLGSYQV